MNKKGSEKEGKIFKPLSSSPFFFRSLFSSLFLLIKPISLSPYQPTQFAELSIYLSVNI